MENNPQPKRYKVPQDIFMDILRILFRNHIRHQITGIQEQENSILLQVHFKPEEPNNAEAKENIHTLLEDYSEYMKDLLGDTLLTLDEDEDIS